jgi:hypothetical protein
MDPISYGYISKLELVINMMWITFDCTHNEIYKCSMFWSIRSQIRQAFVCRLREESVPVVGGLAWALNVASTQARQLVAVFQVLCSLYELTCVGFTQNSLQFISRSPLIHVVSREFCLYRDSLFSEIGDSNDKCSSSLEVQCWNEDETHAAPQSPTQI